MKCEHGLNEACAIHTDFFLPQVALDILRIYSGQIITVSFIKRSDNQARILNGRLGVRKYVKGVGLSYNPADYNLCTIFDLVAARECPSHAYRSIPLDSIYQIKAHGKTYINSQTCLL